MRSDANKLSFISAVNLHTARSNLISQSGKRARKNILASNIFGKGINLNITVFRGAGAYICGEETGLMESLEGKRGQPRLKPPFPAVVGLYGCPTVVNNVETLANLPHIINRGAEWYTTIRTEK